MNAPYTDTIVLVEQRLWMEKYLEKSRDALSEVSTKRGKGEGGAKETKESTDDAGKRGRDIGVYVCVSMVDDAGERVRDVLHIEEGHSRCLGYD